MFHSGQGRETVPNPKDNPMADSNVSEKQLTANRANAQKSTGPKTEEGKKNSRRNASRHHLTGQVMTMTDEDHAAYGKFLKGFMSDLKPEGALETALVQSVAHGYWRLNRAEAIEENNFAVFAENHAGDILVDHEQLHAALLQSMAFFEDPKTFALLTLYEQRIHRKTHKDLQTFMNLRKGREHTRTTRQPEKVMRAVGFGIVRDAQVDSATSVENGFVFSDCVEPAQQPDPAVKTERQEPDSSAELPNVA